MIRNQLLFLQQKKGVLLFFSLLFCSSISFAQQKITVNGNVASDKNEPMAGVSVNVKGSSVGTTTDRDCYANCDQAGQMG